MIDETLRAEIRRLVLGERWAINTVARHFGVHHSVVRRAIKDGADKPRRPVEVPTLEPYKPYIVERLLKYPELTATRLLLELRDHGYAQGVAQVRRFVAKIRGPRSRKAFLRIEVDPGEQAQVDWGSFGQLRIGGTQRPLSCFVMVLSWSRALFLDFSLDQRMETFCAMHRRAFEFFGGVPRKALYDNLKSVVLHHIGSTVQFNPSFLRFAGHYLFEPTAAPPRYPQAKGRVEGAIRMIRHSFFYGRSFSDLADLRAQAAVWRDQVCNARLHATTRERPKDRLLVERTRLRALPDRPPDTDLVVPAIVSKEARVQLDTNTYSVPHGHVGQTVFVRADDTLVRVLAEDGQELARHVRCWDRRRAIEEPAHIEAMLQKRPNGRSHKSRTHIANLAPQCRAYLQEVARRRISLDNETRKLHRLLDRYGQEDFVDGVGRALVARTFGAHYVRACMDQARFARGLHEPPEPIVTGNAAADAINVVPHDLESYDALFPKQEAAPHQEDRPDSAPGDDEPGHD
ncbi:MAG: IS21 family transposase [Myxococcales bacterium]|nr:IS21 family transposase [Myxococcales bacterium]